MPGLYYYMTELYEIVYKHDILDIDTWPKLTEPLVGFLEEFVNVTLRGPQDQWFMEFKPIYGRYWEDIKSNRS